MRRGVDVALLLLMHMKNDMSDGEKMRNFSTISRFSRRVLLSRRLWERTWGEDRLWGPDVQSVLKTTAARTVRVSIFVRGGSIWI